MDGPPETSKVDLEVASSKEADENSVELVNQAQTPVVIEMANLQQEQEGAPPATSTNKQAPLLLEPFNSNHNPPRHDSNPAK